jgi:penicillin-binding protein 1A
MAVNDERREGAEMSPGARLALRILTIFGLALALIVVVPFLLLTLATSLAFKNLPSIDTLTDYRPKIPLRVYTADQVLIGEFGEERRSVVHIADVPLVMKQAILAAEDDRFYQHGGIDYEGVLRATLSNALHGTVFGGGRRQGASTITQQVARNFFLSSEQSYTRKFYEALMAFKIEQSLTKDQILEVYINQIYLGQRAYGFASAEQVYFGKPLSSIDPAEAAMLAGMPKAPSTFNPVVNPARAKARQQYVLGRMLALGFLTEDQYKAAVDERLVVKAEGSEYAVHAEYVAEMARQAAYDQFKEDTYTLGLNVYTTLDSKLQAAAYTSVRNGVLEYERRQKYDGPEAFVDLPADLTGDDLDQAVEDALLEYVDSDDILAAVVLDASPKVVHAARPGETFEITGDGLKMAASGLAEKAPPNKKLRRGAIIRIVKNQKGQWEITEMPQIQAAFVSADSKTGAVVALVGGFDFNRNKFNHVTQAFRQPGSSFKPYLYSAALEKGFTPATVVLDEPIVIDAAQTGSQAWEPKNYDNKYEGPMTLRQALAKSKNMVSIRILQVITPRYVQNYIGRFGLDPERHPAVLAMALGAGSVTPWQMLGGYSVFANGGYKINPYFITHITNNAGQDVARASVVKAGDPANRVIDARNAYTMNSLLQGVARFGTAAGTRVLKRNDIAGKTGTTNDSHDAWFAGYANDNLVGIAWIGFDQPRSLGDRETGGGLALPLWLGFMQVALKGVPEVERPIPPGLVTVGGEIYYNENAPGVGVPPITSDMPADTSGQPTPPAPDKSQMPPYGSVSGAPLPSSPIPSGALAPALPATPQPVPYGTLKN